MLNERGQCSREIEFDHSFGNDKPRPYEKRIFVITIINLFVMVLEIIVGTLTGSMALLSDGLHMGSHVLALSLSSVAYIFARRQAKNRKFGFGTAKVADLAGFSSALILGLSAIMIAIESTKKLLMPVEISYKEALLIAIIGFLVNASSAFYIAMKPKDDCNGLHGSSSHKHDNNIKAAFAHIVADAVTSIAAIVALLGAWRFDINWLDPLVGILASILIAIWASKLIYVTTRVLLDMEAPDSIRTDIIKAFEQDGDSKVIDLHVWSVGYNAYVLIAVISTHKETNPDQYKSLIPKHLLIYHPVIEIRLCRHCQNNVL